VRNWLKRNKRVALHFTPTSSSWLNLVERFFGVLTEHQLKRGIFTSVDELEQKIMAYIDNNNKNPKPFVWTKSAEEILEKVSRARATLDNIQTNWDTTLVGIKYTPRHEQYEMAELDQDKCPKFSLVVGKLTTCRIQNSQRS
jgi:hypothetical protein